MSRRRDWWRASAELLVRDDIDSFIGMRDAHRSSGDAARAEAAFSPRFNPELKPVEAVDPVCRETVAIAPARASGLSCRHEGVEYFFCRAECMDAFSMHPERYRE